MQLNQHLLKNLTLEEKSQCSLCPQASYTPVQETHIQKKKKKVVRIVLECWWGPNVCRGFNTDHSQVTLTCPD